jgi:SAM-dependent methyltransferase
MSATIAHSKAGVRRESFPSLPLNAWLRYDLIQRGLRERAADGSSLLEIGAGAGALSVRLASRYEYTGVEPDPVAFATAARRLRQKPAARMLCGDSSALEPDALFDVVCSFEVLEHIEDDRAALIDWRGRLHPGGILALSVPARPRRFGIHDRVVGHYRRYEAAGLDELFTACGFTDISVYSFGFPLGYALEGARNTVARFASSRASGSMAEQTAASGRWLQPPEGIGWLTAGATVPFRLLQRPFASTGLGTGIVAFARRPA